MKKRIGSVLLALALCLSLLPATAFAAEDSVLVSIGSTALESGKYYVKASDTTTGEPASTRVVDAQDTAPESGAYLEFDGHTLTVHGYLELESVGPAALTVDSGTLTVTGDDLSLLSLTNTSTYAVRVSSSASLLLTGDVSFTVSGTNANGSPALFFEDNAALTTENYSGNFTVIGKASAILGNGTLSVVTEGSILLNRDYTLADTTHNPVVYASELTLQGYGVTVTGDGTLLSSGGDLNVTSTATDLIFSSDSTSQAILKANGTITLSAPNSISLTSALGGSATWDNYAISSSKLVLNDAQTAALTCTGTSKLMPAVDQQIESHVGKLIITQEGKTTVIENGTSTTYDGDITTAGLDFTTGTLPPEAATYLAGSGTAVFTPATSDTPAALTLQNATAGNIKLGAHAVNLVVEGENTVGQVSATNVNINISGSGSLKLVNARLNRTAGTVTINIDGDLTASSSSAGSIFDSSATISAKSIHITSPYAFQNYTGSPVSVSLTATDGDIVLDGVNNQVFTSNIASLTLQAPEGGILSENALFTCPVTATARDDIAITGYEMGTGVTQRGITLNTQNGDISLRNTSTYAAAAYVPQSPAEEIGLSAPNGKITVSGAEHAILSRKGVVNIHAKEVELTASRDDVTLLADTLTLSGDKVTIIGSGSNGRGSSDGDAVVIAKGTIQSNDLLIYATSSNGYAASSSSPDASTLQLKGTGLVIGKLQDGGTDRVVHDSTITVLAPAAPLNTNALETALGGSTKAALSAGNGFVLVDPTEKTLLLHDVTINGSSYTAVSVPDGVTTATIEGALTVSTPNSLDLSGCASVVFKPGASLAIEADGCLYLPRSALADLEQMDLSCDGIITLIDKTAHTSSHVIRVTYELNGGTNASSNPTLYLKSSADENAVTLAAPTKEGYDFKGWYTNDTLTEKIEALTKGMQVGDMDVEAKLTLYAKWEKSQPSSPSSGSSSSRPTYPVTTPDKTENGSVTVTPKSAKQGNTVTITVTPDAGYVLDKLTVTDKDGKELSLTKKSDTEYTFVMPAGKVEITPSFVKQAEEPSRTFVDVKTGDYFYDAVLWAVEKGITNGTSDETFSPEDPCTRAQIVTFLWRAAGSPVVNYAMNMTDVAADAYYAEAVRWALSEGITTGTSADRFSPDATCTREQAVTFLYRAAGSPAVSGESAFEDVGAEDYYARAVAWAAQNGVTNGISQTLFGSGNDCTRAQIVTFLYRAQQGK